MDSLILCSRFGSCVVGRRRTGTRCVLRDLHRNSSVRRACKILGACKVANAISEETVFVRFTFAEKASVWFVDQAIDALKYEMHFNACVARQYW